MLKDGTIPVCFKVIVDGADQVPLCIYGDPAYLLLGCLMKEFSKGGTTPVEELFFISTIVSKNGCGMCFWSLESSVCYSQKIYIIIIVTLFTVD